MGRSPCCSKEGLNRGAWTAIEDKILTSYIKVHGEGKWRNLPKRAGLKRCGKSCRLRWLNYLRPDIKRGNISRDEEELIIRLHKLLGNRWSLIAGRLPGRTDNEIKNYWNTTLGKKAAAQPPSPPSPSNSNAKRLKKQAIEAHTTEPPDSTTDKFQVIRTKATRCTKALVPLPNPPLTTDDHDHNYLIDHPHQQDEEVQEHMQGTGNSDFPNLGCYDEFEASNFDEKLESVAAAAAYNSYVSVGPDQHQLQYLNDETTRDCWTTAGLDDNATINFESLAFLLDPEEWP